MFTIGEFSRITGLTVKTLRFYHEQRLLEPTLVDDRSGYLVYDIGKIETARVVTFLRGLDFSLNDIRQILHHDTDDTEILERMERQKLHVEEKLRSLKIVSQSLQQFINQEREVLKIMSDSTNEVQEKVVEKQLIAGIRMKGKYAECGKGFGRLGKRFGRYISGKPMVLCYDSEYKEIADYETCFAIRKGVSAEDIHVRELPGGKCVSLMHKGPYDQLGRSYAKLLQYIKDKSYRISVPSREIYHKGPGMIFKGNPKNYLTEIQFMIE